MSGKARFGSLPQVLIAAVLVLAFAAAALLAQAQRRSRFDALLRADPGRVALQPALASTALEIGGPAYAAHCAICHGNHGTGDRLRAAPDLTDDEHLYGTGTAQEIEQIILYGIRSGQSKGRNLASMPAYARPQPYQREPIPPLAPAEIDDVTQFVLSLSGSTADPAAVRRGRDLYSGKGGCYDCHGSDAKGDPAIGAPDLSDALWLYGDGSAASIAQSISYGRAGICPAFSRRMSALEARATAIYVASLQHGRTTAPAP
jgi:cytochrome c oxidase cbb3-type subunit 3